MPVPRTVIIKQACTPQRSCPHRPSAAMPAATSTGPAQMGRLVHLFWLMTAVLGQLLVALFGVLARWLQVGRLKHLCACNGPAAVAARDVLEFALQLATTPPQAGRLAPPKPQLAAFNSLRHSPLWPTAAGCRSMRHRQHPPPG